MTEDKSSVIYGAMVDGATEFNHAKEVEGREQVAAVSSVTVYTAKVAQADHEEEVIVDIAFEYNVGGKLRQAGPYGSGASAGAESSTFGLPGVQSMTKLLKTTAPVVRDETPDAPPNTARWEPHHRGGGRLFKPRPDVYLLPNEQAQAHVRQARALFTRGLVLLHSRPDRAKTAGPAGSDRAEGCWLRRRGWLG